ncbi:MAG: hypothetical protein ABTA16_03165 [Niallia sp.]
MKSDVHIAYENFNLERWRKSGVHKGDERHNVERGERKWRSSR